MPERIIFNFGFFSKYFSPIHTIPSAISKELLWARQFVPQWTITYSNEGGNSIFKSLHKTCSVRSPGIPKFRADFLPKYLCQTSGYRVKPAAIESPIIYILDVEFFANVT